MELVEDGAIAVAGLSNHSIELMERALSVGPIGVVQHQYSLLVRDVVTDGVLDWCADHGIPFLAWSPLASGFLVDGFDLDATHATDLRRRLRWATTEQARTELVRSALQTLAEQHDTTMVAVALAWVTRRPASTRSSGRGSPLRLSCSAARCRR